jgi:hypothetical protein
MILLIFTSLVTRIIGLYHCTRLKGYCFLRQPAQGKPTTKEAPLRTARDLTRKVSFHLTHKPRS